MIVARTIRRAVGSLLSPVIAKFNMEHSEETILDRATHKPLCWFRYVDDTFFIWLYSLDRHRGFPDHLNSAHQNIQFTLKT
jgi:hypothetical protein